MDSCAFARQHGAIYDYTRMLDLIHQGRNTVVVVRMACDESKKLGNARWNAYGRRRRIHRFWKRYIRSISRFRAIERGDMNQDGLLIVHDRRGLSHPYGYRA